MSRDPFELPKDKNVQIALKGLESLKQQNPGQAEIRHRIASIFYKTDFEDDYDFITAAMVYNNFDLKELEKAMGTEVIALCVDIRKAKQCPSSFYSILNLDAKSFLIAEQMARLEMVLDGYADGKTGPLITVDSLREMTEALTLYVMEMELPADSKMLERYQEAVIYSQRLQMRDLNPGLADLKNFGDVTPQSFNSFGKKPF